MRLNTTTGTLETSGLAETQNFSIKVTGKAFKILLDGLYADKVAAVIRELSTNAYDAHLAIGKGDTPFEVRLPTVFNPTFIVRDFGVSMSHEQTMRLMSTVFDSTKDSSNNQVGAFGLGSKSPFALVDTFSLTVILDGEKRMYSAFFGPDGIPSIALLGREATTQPRGVEFQMTIEVRDVHAFRERALRILQWFPTIPKVYEGTARLTINHPKELASGNGWKILDYHTYSADHSGAMARQGCVVYPLTAASIPALPFEHRSLMDASIVIDFAIGSLDVAANRESLSYDPQTCSNIIARLNAVSNEIVDHYGKAIKDAPTLWEAGKAKIEAMSGSGLPRRLSGLLSNTKWQGTTPVTSFSFPLIKKKLKDDHTIEFSSYCWDSWRISRGGQAVYLDGFAESQGDRLAWDYGDDKLKIYFSLTDDRPTYEGRRIRDAHQANEAVLLCVVNEEDHAKKILEALGSPTNFAWTKDLPAPVIAPRLPMAKRGKTKKEEVKVREIQYVQGVYELQTEKVVALDGVATYVFMRDGRYRGLGLDGTASADVYDLSRALGSARTAGFMTTIPTPLYGISTTYQKRVEAFDDWKPLMERMKPLFTDYEDKLYEEVERQNIDRFASQDTWVAYLLNKGLASVSSILKSGPLHDLHKLLVDNNIDPRKGSAPKKSYSDFLWLGAKLGLDSATINTNVDRRLQKSAILTALTAASKACTGAYPLIAAHPSYGPSANRDRTAYIAEYIEAINALRDMRAAQAAAKLSTVSTANTNP